MRVGVCVVRVQNERVLKSGRDHGVVAGDLQHPRILIDRERALVRYLDTLAGRNLVRELGDTAPPVTRAGHEERAVDQRRRNLVRRSRLARESVGYLDLPGEKETKLALDDRPAQVELVDVFLEVRFGVVVEAEPVTLVREEAGKLV